MYNEIKIRKNRAVPLGIVLLALALRLLGTGYGLPDLLWVDEDDVVEMSLAYGANRTLEPIGWTWGTLFSYLLFAVYGLTYLFGLLAGAFSGIEDFAFAVLVEPAPFYRIGRVTCAILGAATVLPAMALGRAIAGAAGAAPDRARLAGILAGLAIAVSPLHAMTSRITTMDVPMTLLAAVFWWRWFVAARAPERSWIPCGILLGLAAAVKWNGALLLLPLLAGIFLRGGRPWKGLVHAGIAGGASFVAGCPFVIVRLGAFWEYGIRHQWAYARFGGLGRGEGAPGLWLLTQAWTREPVLCLLLLTGLVYALWKGRGPLRWGAASILVMAVLTAPTKNQDIRYLLLTFPFLYAAAGAALASIPARQPRLALATVPFGIAAVIVLAQGLELTRTDTRTRARRWIEAHLDPEDRIAADEYVAVPPNRHDILQGNTKEAVLSPSLRERIETHLDAHGHDVIPLRVLLDAPPADMTEGLSEEEREGLRGAFFAIGFDVLTHEELVARGVRYVATSDWAWARYFRSSSRPADDNPQRTFYERHRGRYADLLTNEAHFRPVRRFLPGPGRPGPEILLLEVLSE